MIEVDNSQVVRSRVDNATACFYPGNKNRIVVVADHRDFAAAQAALAALTDHVLGEAEKAETARADAARSACGNGRMCRRTDYPEVCPDCGRYVGP